MGIDLSSEQHQKVPVTLFCPFSHSISQIEAEADSKRSRITHPSLTNFGLRSPSGFPWLIGGGGPSRPLYSKPGKWG